MSNFKGLIKNLPTRPLGLWNVPGFPTARKTGESYAFLPSETRFFEVQNPVLVILESDRNRVLA